MRIIYINVGGSQKITSIYKKIAGQVEGLIGNGVDCKGYFLSTSVLECLPFNTNIDFFPVETARRKYFPQLQQQTYFLKALEKLLEKETFDFVYLRFPFSHALLLKLAKQYNKKFIVEKNTITISQLKSEFVSREKTSLISDLLSKIQDYYIPILRENLYLKGILNNSRLIVGVTQELSKYYKTNKTPAITITNGIDIKKYFARSASPFNREKIIMLILDGSSTDAPWQGLDRLVDSIEYYKMENDFEIWIGSEKEELASKKYVKNLGFIENQELEKVFNQVNIGSGKFAPFRAGIQEASALKTREYITRGLPLVFAAIDADIETSDLSKFCFKITNDEQLIDLPAIKKWIINLNEQYPNHPVIMNKLANETLSFEVKMKKLVDYLNN